MMKMACKEYSERIIFFDELDEGEKKIVKLHLKACQDCQSYFNHVMKIMGLLKGTEHSSDEQLTRFIVFENFPDEPDFDGEELSTDRALEIKRHLRECQLCAEKYREMKVEFELLESFVDESIMPQFEVGKSLFSKVGTSIKSGTANLIENWEKILIFRRRKFVFIPAIALGIVLSVILFLPNLTNSNSLYDRLGKLENTEITFLTRSAGMANLQSGVSEFNNGNYLLAVKELEAFISEHSDDPNRDIAQYVCGLAYLFQANRSLDKQIEPHQNQNIEKGIKNLQSVLSISENKRLQEDCNWYIGKACLMKRDGQTAVQYFEKVQNSKGKKAQQARAILAELKK